MESRLRLFSFCQEGPIIYIPSTLNGYCNASYITWCTTQAECTLQSRHTRKEEITVGGRETWLSCSLKSHVQTSCRERFRVNSTLLPLMAQLWSICQGLKLVMTKNPKQVCGWVSGWEHMEKQASWRSSLGPADCAAAQACLPALDHSAGPRTSGRKFAWACWAPSCTHPPLLLCLECRRGSRRGHWPRLHLKPCSQPQTRQAFSFPGKYSSPETLQLGLFESPGHFLPECILHTLAEGGDGFHVCCCCLF